MTHPQTLTRAELEARGHTLLVLEHKDLIPFVAEWFWRQPGAVIWLHHLITLTLLAALVAAARGNPWEGILSATGLGFSLGFFVLVPLHEILHALVYKALGARDVRVRFIMNPFSVYVVAHEFVVPPTRFLIVALAPSAVLTLLLVALALARPDAAVMFWAANLLHHGGTGGDWALWNYVRSQRPHAPWTFDDAHARRTSFIALP